MLVDCEGEGKEMAGRTHSFRAMMTVNGGMTVNKTNSFWRGGGEGRLGIYSG